MDSNYQSTDGRSSLKSVGSMGLSTTPKRVLLGLGNSVSRPPKMGGAISNRPYSTLL